MAAGAERLRRCHRLLDRRDFQRMRGASLRARSDCFVLLVEPRPPRLLESAPDAEGSRLGVTASRRVGNSVERNYVKRRVREWFRTGGRGRTGPQAADLVVIARRPALRLCGTEIRAELDRLAASCRSRWEEVA